MKEKRMVKLFSAKDGGAIKVGKKPNRNDKCPCMSGIKYKHCHWIAHQQQIVNFKTA